MATLAEKRAWLRDNTNEDIPTRGRLRPDLERLFDDAHPNGQASVFSSDADWDIDDAHVDMLSADELEPDVPMEPERRPRTTRTARAERRQAATPTARAEGFVARLLAPPKAKGKPGPKPKGKQPPRISLEKFTTRAYSTLGRMVAPISQPMSNCLQAQAAMAGVIFEDTAQGTILDRLLQPAARAEDKLDKMFALVAPPLIVLGIEQSASLPPQQAMVRQAFLMPLLRESLRIGLEVSESYADQMRARIESEARYDAEVDELIKLIFAMPQATAEDVPEPEMAGASA